MELQPPIVVEVPAASPPAHAPPIVVASAPPPVVPVYDCVVRGEHMRMESELELCETWRAGCFARVRSDASVKAKSFALANGGSITARLELRVANGFHLWGVADVHSVPLHPARPLVLGRFFVPQHAEIRPQLVHHGDIDIDVLTDEATAQIPIRVTRACDYLSLEEPSFTRDDVERALGLGAPITYLALASTSIELRQTPVGPTVAQLAGDRQDATVYAHDHGFSRVIVTLRGGWATGWVQTSALVPKLSWAHAIAVRAPEVGYAGRDPPCDHDVPFWVVHENRLIRIGTIPAGVRFDHAEPHAGLELAGIRFQAMPFVRAEDVACR